METSPFASMMPDRPPTEDVRYPQNSGKHLLGESISRFDPERTFCCLDLCLKSVYA
jgi:hypothetical protein